MVGRAVTACANEPLLGGITTQAMIFQQETEDYFANIAHRILTLSEDSAVIKPMTTFKTTLTANTNLIF